MATSSIVGEVVGLVLLEDRVTVDGGDVLECRSDQVGELADKLVVRHASAVSTELPIQLDPCSTYGVC